MSDSEKTRIKTYQEALVEIDEPFLIGPSSGEVELCGRTKGRPEGYGPESEADGERAGEEDENGSDIVAENRRQKLCRECV